MKVRYTQKGFSLTEVVIALAIVAFSLPVILGVFARLSSSSDKVRDLHDVETVLAAVQNYLENDTATTSRFMEVYGWVNQARQDPDGATALYAYRPAADNVSAGNTAMIISETVPSLDEVSNLDSRVVVVKLHAPEETLLPVDAFPQDVESFEKAYLPMRLDFFVVTAGNNNDALGRPFETLPFVLKR